MAQFLSEYGLFLLELLTVLILVGLAAVLIAAAARRGAGSDGLTIEHLNEDLERKADLMRRVLLGKDRFRKQARARARQRKRERREKSADRRRVFVLDFKGDIRASAAASLREEVSAILAVAEDSDEVVLRLENAGGAVHEHGFAASQLLRLKNRRLRLTIAVDKVAASGGYLMACIADHLIAAPFAIIGSIGVVAQLPNFHRLLENKGIDFEQITAGRYKRTLTLFGENTEEGRQKLREELDEVHALFKRQIAEQRPAVDLESVATGEHWYGTRALELALIDAIGTSEDYLLAAADDADLYKVTYKRKRSLQERFVGGAEGLLGL